MPRIVDFDLTGTIAANDFVPLWGTDDGKTQRVLAAGFVSSGLIGVGAVESSNIANATIVAGNIANATIIANNIANATITALQIKNATITAAQIENATITAGKIKNATITAVQIENATITGSKIATATIMAGNIVDATITGGKIANATVMAGNIGNGTIIGGNIADSTITGGLLVDQTITTGKIGLLQITAAVISNLTITAGKIENGTITGGKVATSTLDKTNLNFTAFDVNVDDLDDVDDGLTYAKILTTDISAGHIKLSECTGSLDNIADGIGENSYGKVLVTDISAGHILLSECTGSLDDVDDGLTYGKVATTSISAGKIVLTLGVSGSLPVANSDAKCTDVNADQTSANTAALVAALTGHTLDNLANGATYGRVNLTAISAGKIVLTALGVTGTLPTALSAAKCEDALADQTSANTAADITGQGALATMGEGDIELDNLTGTTKASILQTVVDAGYVKLIRLAADTTERFEITAGGVEGYANNVKNFELASGEAYLGDQANEHVKLSASGLEIKDNTTVLATYGTTVVIGEVGAGLSNIEITSGALNLRNNVTVRTKLDTDGSGWLAGDGKLNWDTAGNITMTGSITLTNQISSGNISDVEANADQTSVNTAADTSKVGGLAAASIAGWAMPAHTTYINGGDIYTNTIVADAINTSTLSAITANLGTVTAGIAKSSDGKLTIDFNNKWLKVWDVSNVLRVHLGYIA